MPKYIDASLHTTLTNLPIVYTSTNDTTAITGNLSVLAGDLIINNNKLKLRGNTDIDNIIHTMQP